MTKKKKEQIVSAIGEKFRTFGGGRTSEWNPIVNATKDKPLQFAAGVDVMQVVEFVIAQSKKVKQIPNVRVPSKQRGVPNSTKGYF